MLAVVEMMLRVKTVTCGQVYGSYKTICVGSSWVVQLLVLGKVGEKSKEKGRLQADFPYLPILCLTLEFWVGF